MPDKDTTPRLTAATAPSAFLGHNNGTPFAIVSNSILFNRELPNSALSLYTLACHLHHISSDGMV